MRRLAITFALLILFVMAGTCFAGELTGSRNYGILFNAGAPVFSSGITLDYEIAPDLYLTLDLQTQYSKTSKLLNRIELSANWYPNWWIFKGWCVSVGGALKTETNLQLFLEFSTPLSIPKWLRFWK